jgi:hypothetical protein
VACIEGVTARIVEDGAPGQETKQQQIGFLLHHRAEARTLTPQLDVYKRRAVTRRWRLQRIS